MQYFCVPEKRGKKKTNDNETTKNTSAPDDITLVKVAAGCMVSDYQDSYCFFLM